MKLSTCAHFQDAVKRGAESEGAGSEPAAGTLLPTDEETAARTAGRTRDEAPEDRISDSCGSVGGAGCCPRRERQGSDLCEPPRTSHPKPKPKPNNSTSALSMSISILIGLDIWGQGGKKSCQNEGGKKKPEPIITSLDSAQPCGAVGAWQHPEGQGGKVESSRLRGGLTHHLLGYTTGYRGWSALKISKL